MGGNKAGNRSISVVTVIIIIVTAAAAAGLFLLFTLYDFGAGHDIPQTADVTAQEVSAASESDASAQTVFTQPDDPLLVLVNAEHQMPEGTDSGVVEQYGIMLDSRALEAYGKLYQAAVQDGVTLWIASGYRSPELQAQLYRQEIDTNMAGGMTENEAVQAAGRAVQQPGFSEHNTGLAMDFNTVTDSFQNTDAYAWLMEHAQEYGFVLRYPKDKEHITGIMYEPWHFRYVGTEQAKKMNELDMCLEEYVEYISAR